MQDTTLVIEGPKNLGRGEPVTGAAAKIVVHFSLVSCGFTDSALRSYLHRYPLNVAGVRLFSEMA